MPDTMTPLAEMLHLAHELERRGKPATSVDARAALALRASYQEQTRVEDELQRLRDAGFKFEDCPTPCRTAIIMLRALEAFDAISRRERDESRAMLAAIEGDE